MQEQPNQPRSSATPGVRPESQESKSPTPQSPKNLSDRAERVAEQAKSAAIDRVQAVRDQAQSGLDQGRNQVVTRIRHVSSALKSAGDELRKEDEVLARYVAAAGDRVERAASYVSSAEPGQVLRDVEDLARRKPAWFFGGAFLLGLAGGRFLKASRESSSTRGGDVLDEHDFYPQRPNYDAYRRQQTYAKRAYGSPEPAIPRTPPPTSRPIEPNPTVSVTSEPRSPAPSTTRGPNRT